jgi:hypothetical protein
VPPRLAHRSHHTRSPKAARNLISSTDIYPGKSSNCDRGRAAQTFLERRSRLFPIQSDVNAPAPTAKELIPITVCVSRTGQPSSDSCSARLCGENSVLPDNARHAISCAFRHHSSGA